MVNLEKFHAMEAEAVKVEKENHEWCFEKMESKQVVTLGKINLQKEVA